jgi:membrane associated rhomboid family serine protease
MASFLKFVSGVYLVIVWLCVGIAVLSPVAPMTQDQGLIKVAAILAGIIFAVPAASVMLRLIPKRPRREQPIPWSSAPPSVAVRLSHAV